MKLELNFKNINSCNGVPLLKISVNQQVCWDNPVQEKISLEYAIDVERINLTVEHYGKNNLTDTISHNGLITQDKNCELDSIVVDGYNLAELKWRSYYQTQDGERLDQCLFFGKNGCWHLTFDLPILRWILKTQHETKNNDPHWEEDYENYIQACKLINNLN